MLAGLAGALVACSGTSASTVSPGIVLTTPVADPTATPTPVITKIDGQVVAFEVNLALNGSPQQGTATFTRQGDTSRVVVRLRPGAPVQGVTLRRGTCSAPEGFEESLDAAIGGVLRQNFRKMSFDELLKGGLTLVVTTDANSFQSVAACADLPRVE